MIYSLYVKEHNTTHKKYLGQTKHNPNKYKGSGIDWIHHIKNYGNDVSTHIIATSDNKNEINDLGRYYSKGMKWFNNGSKKKMRFECPEGFILGRNI